MQIIHDALQAERLAEMKRLFEHEEIVAPEQRAAELDGQIRAVRDAREKADDRNRHERRKATALARRA